ncbi:MAG: hypothetical protein EOM20_17510 [Spartobacteria bacterium]|nr:hypothetical protein [Spartobacteria bacterium]
MTEQNENAAKLVCSNALLAKLNPAYGIIGIDPDLNVYEGYDGRIESAWIAAPEWMEDEDATEWNKSSLSQEEKVALGQEMIRRWSAYVNAANAKVEAER